MSRKIFWIGNIFILLLYLGGIFIISQKGKGGPDHSDFKVSGIEKFLYDLYTGKISTKKRIISSTEKEDIDLYSALDCFLNCKADSFLSSNWLSKAEKWEDIKLMVYIAEKETRIKDDFRQVNLEKLIFKVNYYRYVKLFGINYIAEKDFWNLKQLMVYAHDKNFLDVGADIGANLMFLPFKDPEILAYYGSILTKYALVKNSPVEKMDYVAKGTYFIDEAVNNYEDFLIPRFVRIFNYLSLPIFFKKGKFIEEDLSFLISSYRESKKLKIVKRYGEIEEIEVPIQVLKKIKKELENNKIFSKEKNRFYINLIDEIDQK